MRLWDYPFVLLCVACMFLGINAQVSSTGATVTYPTGAVVYTFKSGGTITFSANITFDLLIVGGGGGGGISYGGGGGGGGIVYATGVSRTAGSYSISVASWRGPSGTGHSSSAFGGYAYGGGAGGSGIGNSGGSGGNGGGGCGGGAGGTADTIGILPSAPYTTAQLIGGQVGGTVDQGSYSGGKGGGGYSSAITGTSVLYANGGGGYTGWSMGSSNAPYTGGGGGGGSGGDIGSEGIVVIRILIPTSCPFGQYIGAVSCLPCTNGGVGATYTGSGTTSTNCPVSCLAGYYRVNSANCGPCTNAGVGGNYTGVGTNSTNCPVSCFAGYYRVAFSCVCVSGSYGVGGTCVGFYRTTTNVPPTTLPSDPGGNVLISGVLTVAGKTFQSTVSDVQFYDWAGRFGWGVVYHIVGGGFGPGSEAMSTPTYDNNGQYIGSAGLVVDGTTVMGFLLQLHMSNTVAIRSYSYSGIGCGSVLAGSVDGSTWTQVPTTVPGRDCTCDAGDSLRVSCAQQQVVRVLSNASFAHLALIGTSDCACGKKQTWEGLNFMGYYDLTFQAFDGGAAQCAKTCATGTVAHCDLMGNTVCCGPGYTFQDGVSTTPDCEACAAGTYSSDGGACVPCTNAGVGGSYTGALGITTPNCPVSCFAGYYQAAFTCLSCPIGTFSLANSTYCSACTNGGVGRTFTSSGTTSSNCQIVCSAGYYPVGAVCMQCAVGRYSGVNSTNCSACTNTPATGFVFTRAGTNSTNCRVSSIGATSEQVSSAEATITTSGVFAVYSFSTGVTSGISGFITFITTKTVDLLIVGGGGGGGNDVGGGGGGGGIVYATGVSISPGTYDVVVGAGGASTTNGYTSSVFGASAYGGGYGGCCKASVGASGANGGGGSFQGIGGKGLDGGSATTIGILPTVPATTAQLVGGYSGAYGDLHGGGGGGAGGLPGWGFLGDGGAGYLCDITGTSLYWSGGGGGGAAHIASSAGGSGGSGGGGNGMGLSASGSGNSGGTNTGGGGGGGKPGSNGGTGGSGIVVIRVYPPPPTSCPSGQYIGTISCQPCTYGGVGVIYTGFGTNSTNCPVRCSAGYYQVAFSCLSCPIGKFSLANQTGASSCQPCTNAGVGGNYTGFGTTSTNCPVSCFAGYYQAAFFCLSCPIGMFSLATSTDCSACTNLGVGRTFASFGTTSSNCPTVCAAGYYAVGATCSQCAVGRYSGANSTNCSVCTNTLAAGSVFTTAGTNSTNCQVGCAAGYAYGTASSACMRCSAGEFLYSKR